MFTPVQLALLFFGGSFDHFVSDLKATDDVFVQNADAAGRDRSHGEFFVNWHAELAHDKNVHWNLKAAGNFVGHGHTTSWKREHDYIIVSGIFLQHFRKISTGVMPVSEKFRSGFEHNDSPFLETGRKCVRQLALLPAGTAVERFHSATLIKMEDRVELFRDLGGKVMAVALRFRSIDHANRTF